MRFVIKRNSNTKAGKLSEVEALPGVTILDRTGKSAVLVEADEAIMAAHLPLLENWTVAPEVTYARPERLPVSLSRSRQ